MGESLNVKFLGYNEGRWHHMDNVFAILSFMGAISQFAPHHYKPSVREFANTFACGAAVVAQLMSPWDVLYTLAPILFAVIYVFLSTSIARRFVRMDGSSGKRALVALAAAVFFFVKGLNERTDWLRLFHGGWHVTVGIFFYYLLCTIQPERSLIVTETKRHPE